MEIAYDLAEGGARKVWLAVRTPPNIVLRAGPGGLPGDVIGVVLLHLPVRIADAIGRFGQRMDPGDLSEYGLPAPEEGIMSRLKRLGVAPAVVDSEVIDAIKERRIEVVRAVESLDATGVQLADGERIEPDAVVCATGYRRTLDELVGHLGVLDHRVMPRARGADAAAPGLRFIGYVPRPGGLNYMGKEARRAAKAIARELRSAPAAPQAAEPLAA
jgi:cation diffusion facilitator CzcD-associated flavoprotein CzcO